MSTKTARAPRIPPVDRKYYEDKIGAIDADVKAIKDKVQALTKTIASKSTGKDDYYAQKEAVKALVDAAQKKIDELEKKKTEVSEKIKKLIASSKDAESELRT